MSSDKSSTSLTTLQSFDFHNAQLSTAKDETTGKVYCVPREIAEHLGVSWSSQLAKLKGALYQEFMVRVDINTDAGMRQTTLLDVTMLPTWLLSIQAARVHESHRARLLEFQRECAQALHNYWTTGIAVNPRLTDTDKLRLASEIMGIYEHLAGIFRAPLHIALQEGVKYAEKAHGVDLRPLLLTSAAVEDIQDSDRMLEPTELARELGYRSAMALNKALETLGWQRKHAGVWEATEEGFPHCTRHAWINQGKSGYNLKWNVVAVQTQLRPQEL